MQIEASCCKSICLTIFQATTPKEPRALAVCTFEKHACGWVDDGNNWQHGWTIRMQEFKQNVESSTFPALCLLPKAKSRQDADEALSWLPKSLQNRKSSTTALGSIQARISSPPLPTELGLRCLKFVYSAYLGSSKADKTIELSLLQRQEGCFYSFHLSMLLMQYRRLIRVMLLQCFGFEFYHKGNMRMF